MSDFFAQIAAERQSFRAEMPPAIQQAIDKIVDELVAELGESPEAWRGAIEAVTALLTQPIATSASELGSALAKAETVLTMMMLVLGQWLSHPTVMACAAMWKEAKRGAQAAEQAEQ